MLSNKVTAIFSRLKKKPQEVRIFYTLPSQYPLTILTARDALYNYLATTSLNGHLFLRVDDLQYSGTQSLERKREIALENAEILKWIGVEWQEGAFAQLQEPNMAQKAKDFGSFFTSERKEIYLKTALQMVE
jgi:glutamyl/glutaminyl-tRNA synthetase